jgi:hypothetical protein
MEKTKKPNGAFFGSIVIIIILIIGGICVLYTKIKQLKNNQDLPPSQNIVGYKN